MRNRLMCAGVLLSVALFAAMPSVAIADDGSAGSDEAATDGVIVVAEDSSIRAMARGEGDVDERLRDAGFDVADCVDLPDGQVAYVAASPSGTSDEEAAVAASELPGVAYAQPNYVYEMIGDVASDAGEWTLLSAKADSGLALYAALKADDPYAQISSPYRSPNQYWLYNAKLTDAWNEATSDHAVTIAVLDTVVRAGHEDLAANVLTRYAWDAFNETTIDFGKADYSGENAHGTHVAGVAAGVADNGLGIAGASYNASILPVQVMREVTDSAGNIKTQSSTQVLVRAFSYLIDLKSRGVLPNLRVANMSLGSYKESVNDLLLREAISLARDEYGIVTVCAGGNGDKAGNPHTDPLYPADFEDCVAVTALTSQGTNAVWSDYNQSKDISAPGVGIWSTFASGDAAYASASGTSSASPMVVGAFALMFSEVGSATVDDACTALYATATPIVDSENDRSKASGSHGALDAEAAVAYLKAYFPWHFTDVASTSWYYRSVGLAAERGIMTGYPTGKGQFGPNDPMPRSQMAATLYKFMGEGAVAPAAPLSDVRQDKWYSTSVNWAVEHAYMSGNGKTFNLYGTVTREQVATIIANIAGADVAAADPAKFDALADHDETSAWARQSVIWAVDAGVLGGFENADGSRSLRPGQAASRAEVAALMMNAINLGVI